MNLKKFFSFIILILAVNSISYGFDNIKNGWYINVDLGAESIYIKEKIYDYTSKKTVSKSSDVTGGILDIGFGYIFKDNFTIGAGLYYSSLGKSPSLLTNKKNNEYFDIYESGSYLSIGYNFKEKHYIKLFFLSSSISGNEKFIKDSKTFDGTGSMLQYSYEVINHLLISGYFRFNSFVNENEWSNKIDIGSFGIKIGWMFY